MNQNNWKINCDLGEGMANDEVIMPWIDQCSIACGGHTGDFESMQKTAWLAKNHHVSVGAHPSYPDPKNFGRKPVDIALETLEHSLINQVAALSAICQTLKMNLDYIKPHGALYNTASKDKNIAKIIIQVLKKFRGQALMAPWRSEMALLAAAEGIPVIFEAFADRAYQSDGSLVSRNSPGSVISSPQTALTQVLSISRERRVKTIENQWISMKADSFCIHGDNPAAVAILKTLKKQPT